MIDRASSEFVKSMEATMRLAMKMKKVMQKKGLTRAKAECPDCKGHFLHGRIVPSKRSNGALRFWCDGDCGKNLME